ncbi:MAG: Bax inhibitor-1/YccA family protein [Lactobacillaceae bacterium]|jgi:FtsH-binding integral membrane protein|nr:Bax inhibitor-1/YccA family protein [Lactobacillaceae bacterium]
MENKTQVKTVERVDEGLRVYMSKVYNYMAGGLIVTAMAAYFTVYTPLFNLFFTPEGLSVFGWIILFAPLVMAFAFASVLTKGSTNAVKGFFWAFSAVMGMSLAPILLAYTGTSVTRIFLITAAMFGGMSIYGYTTKKDLTSMGSFLIMGLWGIIIASVVNIFLGSTGLSFIVSILAVGIFVGLTAYDTQKIRDIYAENDNEDLMTRKVVSGAVSIYLDFINLFLALLRLFGDRR